MIYRLLLRLYPAQFRREYQDELEADFEAMRLEARASGRRTSLLRCYFDAVADLAVSVPRQWLRTPWLAAVTIAAAIATTVFYYVVVRVYRAGSFAGATPPQSPALIWLMAAMVLVPAVIMLLVGLALRFAVTKLPDWRRRA
jgi:hypothetical protein